MVIFILGAIFELSCGDRPKSITGEAKFQAPSGDTTLTEKTWNPIYEVSLGHSRFRFPNAIKIADVTAGTGEFELYILLSENAGLVDSLEEFETKATFVSKLKADKGFGAIGKVSICRLHW